MANDPNDPFQQQQQEPESQSFNSAALSDATYDPNDQTLEVTFQSGDSYVLQGVDPNVWAQMKAAPSVGKFWNSILKGRF